MATVSESKETGGVGTSQYKAVQHYHGNLLDKLQHVLPEVTDEFFTNGLISSHELGAATTGSRLAHYNTASEIMRSIMTKIESNIKWYHVLIQVLKSSSLSDIGEEIERRAWDEDYQHYSPSSPMISTGARATAAPPLLHKKIGPSNEKKVEESDREFDSAYQEPPSSSASIASLSQAGSLRKRFSSSVTATTSGNVPVLCGVDVHPSTISATPDVQTTVAEEAVDSASNGRSKLEVGRTVDVCNVEYKREIALLQREKEGLETDLKHLNKIRSDEKKSMRDQTIMLSQFQEDVDKKENIIKHFKKDREIKNEEIKKLRSEKAELEARIKELSAYFEAEQMKKAEELKNQYQETVNTLTQELEKAEKEKTKALADLQAMREELERIKQREKEALNEVETSTLKLLEKEKEVSQYKLIEQKLESEIKMASLTTEKLLANKDKELAETDAKLYKLQAQCAEEREKCAREREEALRRELEALRMKEK